MTGTIFRNDENGYSVITVKFGRKEITAIGVLPDLAIGEQIILDGTLVHHPQYGEQLKVTTFQIVEPTDLLGIERFLASGLIRGVKSATAKQIVKHFGMETFNVLDAHPERLTEIKGIGKPRATMIAESYHDTINLRTSMVFLTSYGIPASLSARIARKYGDETEKIIREDPYRLCSEIEGIGFQTADRIALTLGFSRDTPARIEAGILYTLQEQSMGNGHCYLPLQETIRSAAGFLQVSTDLLETALSNLSVQNKIICEQIEDEGIRVYLPQFFHAEEEVAEKLLELLHAVPRGDREKGELRIRDFERKNQITYTF